METTSRRVWLSGVWMDSTNSFLTETMDKTNIYWLGKFDHSCYPRSSLNQKTSNTLPQQISKELYNIQLLANFLKPTSQAYFETSLRDMFLIGTRYISYLV